MRFSSFIIGLTTSITFTAQAANVDEYINQLPAGANLALMVQKVGAQAPEIDYHSQQMALPASTQKVITALAALLQLGPDFRFTTTLETKGNVEGGELKGDLIARSGESVEVRDRLALDGKKAGGYFNQQIVEPIAGKNGPLGYLRLALGTHTLATEAQQVDNTTNILRLMLLLSLAIGVVLTRTLLQGKRTRWQQSPFLLTANKPVEDEDDEKKGNL